MLAAMAKVELELERLAQIQEVMGAKLPEIVGGMVATMTTEIDQLEEAMQAGALDRAAKAAHACRNDALMIGARQLLSALTALETAAREGQEELARQQLVALREAWPATRTELMRVAAGG
jgi:HPt (histidine-containing phosphotransfer) domain-containing protein